MSALNIALLTIGGIVLVIGLLSDPLKRSLLATLALRIIQPGKRSNYDPLLTRTLVYPLFVDRLDHLIPVPMDADNPNELLGRNLAHRDACFHLFEACQATVGKETMISLVEQVLMLVP